MQLMDNYCPCAAGLLCFLVPMFEPLGLDRREPDSLLGFEYTPTVLAAIAATAVLGLLVSLSTFLVIGATSSLTYNVVRCSLSTPRPTPRLAGWRIVGAAEHCACMRIC